MTPHRTDCRFLTLHALRIRGFATASLVADMCALPETDVSAELEALASDALAVYRAPRSLWQITPAGRAAHLELLENERAAVDLTALTSTYGSFLALNDDFKTICSDWQLRPSTTDPLAANDHSDSEWDRRVLQELSSLDEDLRAVCIKLAGRLARFAGYDDRFAAALARAERGEHSWVTRPRVDSCHTVWMELHEDLLATLGMQRGAEPTG